jgi:PGF-pre-PGF domain-containing protein
MKKIMMISFIFIFLLIPIVMGQGAPPAASWWGKVEIDGNTSTNNAVIEALINGVVVANTTVGVYTSDYYLLDVPCTNGTNVTIKVYGVEANQSGKICSQGVSTELNLTMNKTANGVVCTYAGGCSSGFCVDGYCCNEACSDASEDCNVSGHEGACTSTAATTTTTGGGGGGGGISISVGSYVSLAKGKANITILSITTEEKATVTIAKYEDVAIRGINISVKNNVTNVKIMISKLSLLPSTIPYDISGEVYHYINIEKINITDSDIDTVNINFAVNKTWLKNNNIDALNITLYRWADNKWNELTTTYVSEDASEVLYQAVSPGLSIFVIGTKGGALEHEQEPTGAAIICEESWSCTKWSSCTNGVQTRRCTDSNNCGTTANKPAESRSCVSLFPESAIPLGLGIGLVVIVVLVIIVFLTFKKRKSKKKQVLRMFL